jgi:signal transduction histidine kinase
MGSDDAAVIALRRERVDGVALLQSSLAPLVAQCAALGIELRVVSDSDVPAIFVDPEKVAWAISAIVGSSARHLRRDGVDAAGGSILVHLTNHEPDEDEVALDGASMGARAVGQEIAIAVQDDGPGIPTERLPMLLQRGPGESHASGLALSLVNDIVKAHGGRVLLDSSCDMEDHYTCITLVLPKQ